MSTDPEAASVATQVTSPSGPNFGVSAVLSSSSAPSPGGANAAFSGMFRTSFRGKGRNTCRRTQTLASGRYEPYIVEQQVVCFGPRPTMLNDVYNRRIIELAGTIPRIGRLAEPDATSTAVSKLCGSTVTIDLKMDGEKVSDFAHEVKACALGQASSSIMARNVVGSTAAELRALRDGMRKMLKENGQPPAAGKWADIAVLEPVRDYKARHASTLLTFDAVVDAINQIEAKRASKSPAAASVQ
jgi:NifU-like protein involved in Fe-S cluster formation